MVGRELRPDFVNRIANSDAVRPFFRPDGEPVDLTPVVETPSTQSGCVVLSNGEDAVAIFELTAPRVYQSHTLFAETCRGRRAIDTAKEMVAWMFAHGADVVWGCTPRENRKACWFNRQIGAVSLPTSDDTHENFEIRKAGAPRLFTGVASDSDPMLILQHHDIDAFLETAAVGPDFRDFVRSAKPLVGPDRPSEVIVMSNGRDVAAAFAYRAARSWQMFATAFHHVSHEDMAVPIKAMLDQMFERGADSIFCFGRPGDTGWQDFHRAIGARSLQQLEDAEIFEITRRTH